MFLDRRFGSTVFLHPSLRLVFGLTVTLRDLVWIVPGRVEDLKINKLRKKGAFG